MEFLDRSKGAALMVAYGFHAFPDNEGYDFMILRGCLFAIRYWLEDGAWEMHIAAPKESRKNSRQAAVLICDMLGDVKIAVESHKKNVINLAVKCGFRLDEIKERPTIEGEIETIHIMTRGG